MGREWWGGVTLVAISIVTGGCTIHNVTYVAYVKPSLEPTTRATAIDGDFEAAKKLFEQSTLPHNTIRQKFELQCEAVDALTSQIGSEEYVLIGEVYGGGNARATIDSLRMAFCKKAAKNGGDVVMVVRTGTEARPFIYSTPGYSTTNAHGSAYRSGDYVYGNATANTTYMPGQTYSGTLYLPYANGIVFKYVPGTKRRREALRALDEETFARVLAEINALNDPCLSFEETMRRADRILARATTKPLPAMSPEAGTAGPRSVSEDR